MIIKSIMTDEDRKALEYNSTVNLYSFLLFL